jgi:hypothetical protein
MGEYQSNAVRLQVLLSGNSELGRSRAAWHEADRLARRIAAEGGIVQIPSEVRAWLSDKPLSDGELERLVSRQLYRAALPGKVRRWVEGSIVEMRKRQEAGTRRR